MTEPLDPSAAGVASALKNLRARAGLTKERLSGSELARDTLAGLPVVRQLIDAGEEPESAIMYAVQEAAKTLEPTLGIVADVSLALGRERSPDQIPDADLYAQDLGQRREALPEELGPAPRTAEGPARKGARKGCPQAGGRSRRAHRSRRSTDRSSRLLCTPQDGGSASRR